MGHKPAIIEDLLANIPGVVMVQSSSSLSQLKPKLKRVKKAKAKATVTQIDTVSISKLVEVEKNQTAAEKRPTEADASDSQPSKRPRSDQLEGRRFPHNMTWAPKVMVGDRPLTVGDSVINDVKVIQHTHSNAIKTEMARNELAKKTKEAAKLLTSLNHAEVNNRALLDQAKASKDAQNQAEKKAKMVNTEAATSKANLEAAKARVAELEVKLQKALDSKEADVKVADEKAFEKGQAAVRDQYKEQPKDSGDEANEDGNADDEEEEAATDAKSPTLNEQVLDLTEDEEDDLASKGTSPKPTFEVQCAEESLDQTLLEIDAEIVVEKNVILATKADKTPTTEVEQSHTNPSA
ncbi:uncharacterized protein LOC114262639 [Camellia sinensis]|uniref:uncharacterized protein LOC114262639 n=1 Tax=Camellia sinensis TaxID=4442 RepID=UPI0010361C1D|nr:uncharacterized protein LOC114262639 [Camellia sinensis]